jgi:hypothetical protein
VEARAVHQPSRAELSPLGDDDDARAFHSDRADPLVDLQLTAEERKAARHGTGYLSIAHNACVLDPECASGVDVGFPFAKFAWIQGPNRDAIRRTSPRQFVETLVLPLVHRYHHLARPAVRYPLAFAEPIHLLHSLTAQLRLQAARLVVESRVNDATVVARLMCGDAILGLQDRHARPMRFGQIQGGRESNGASTNDNRI